MTASIDHSNIVHMLSKISLLSTCLTSMIAAVFLLSGLFRLNGILSSREDIMTDSFHQIIPSVNMDILPRTAFSRVALADIELTKCDWTAYLGRYPDLAALTHSQAKEHFESIGMSQGRSCLKEFTPVNLEKYLARSYSKCLGAMTHPSSPAQNSSEDVTPIPTKVRLLNVGSGSTGTGFLFDTACHDLELGGVHWMNSCRMDKFGVHSHNETALQEWYKLAWWWADLKDCVAYTRTKKNFTSEQCKSDYFLKRLHTAALQVFKKVEIVMDTPMDTVYAELAPYTTQAMVVLTLRQPHLWVPKRRFEHSEYFLFCKSQLLQKSTVRHPFDLPGCLKQTEFAYQALENDFNEARIVDAYRKMNAYNAGLSQRTHIMCMWDLETIKERGREEFISAWEHFTGEKVIRKEAAEPIRTRLQRVSPERSKSYRALPMTHRYYRNSPKMRTIVSDAKKAVNGRTSARQINSNYPRTIITRITRSSV